MAPLLSIVTPCLNARDRIERCLASVRDEAGALAPGLVEHIVVDAGSTDGTLDVIQEHASHLARWTSEPDQGQSDAINKGFAGATGKWGAWLNADDWLEPGALRAVADAIDANPDADLIVGRCRFVNDAGETVWAPVPPDPLDLPNLLRLRSQWFAGRSIAQPEAFFRLDRFHDVGGLDLDNHHSMDYDLWLRLLEAGARFVSIDVPVACLGVHPGQKTADNRAAVSSALHVARRTLERHPGVNGPIRSELDAMGAKLERSDRLLDVWTGALAPEVPADCASTCSAWIAGARAASSNRRCAFLLGEGLRSTGRLKGWRRKADILVISPFAEELAPDLHDQAPRRYRVEPIHPLPAPSVEPGRWDAIVTECTLIFDRDPRALLAHLWQGLKPGGVLAQWGEPAETPAIGEYVAWLRARLDENLSKNDDVLLHPQADPLLQDWLDAPASARLPGARGVDDRELFRDLPYAEQTELLHYGSLGPHPLFPFPFIGPDPLARKAAWISSVWIKHA